MDLLIQSDYFRVLSVSDHPSCDAGRCWLESVFWCHRFCSFYSSCCSSCSCFSCSCSSCPLPAYLLLWAEGAGDFKVTKCNLFVPLLPASPPPAPSAPSAPPTVLLFLLLLLWFFFCFFCFFCCCWLARPMGLSMNVHAAIRDLRWQAAPQIVSIVPAAENAPAVSADASPCHWCRSLHGDLCRGGCKSLAPSARTVGGS